MNIHEFQAKLLFAQFGVPVPAGSVATTAEEARATAEKLFAGGHKRVAVKSQIHAGGRGKGRFKSGLQGGVKVCSSAGEVFERAGAMLGQALVTKQTGPEGRVVNKLLVEAASVIRREFYVAVLLGLCWHRAPDHQQASRNETLSHMGQSFVSSPHVPEVKTVA